MLVKKEMLYQIIICIISVIICGYCLYISEFPGWVKLALFFAVLVGNAGLMGGRKKTLRLFTASVVIVFGINVACYLKSYGEYWINNSATMNIYTKSVMVQTVYVKGIGNADVILPSLLREKTVYIFEKDPYKEYFSYFAAETITDASEKFQISDEQSEIFKQKCVYLGRMSISTMDYLVSEKTHDEITDYILSGKSPVLYVASADVADNDKLIILSDSQYNIFILPEAQFEAEIGNGKE